MKKLILFIVTSFFSVNSSTYAQEDIAILAKAFGQLPEIQSVDISPDGTKLLMMQNYQGRKILVTRSLIDPDAPPNGIPPLENQEFNWAMWASNDRILASIRFPYTDQFMGLATWGTYETRLISMDWKGDDPVNPIKGNDKRSRQTQIQDIVVDLMKEDPNHILVSLDIRERGDYGVYKVDITKTRNPVLVIRGNRHIASWATDANHVVRYGDGASDRRGALRTRYVSHYRKSKDDRWETLFDIDLKKGFPPFEFEGFSKDPNIIYVTAKDETGRKAAYTFDVNTKQFIDKIASVDGYDITSIYVDEHDEPELYIWYDKQPRIAYFDEEKQATLELLKRTFPGTSINFHGETEDKNTIVFETTSPTEPGTYYVFDKANRKMEMLGFNYANVEVANLSEMTPITYKARDELEIPGYLSLPKGEDPKLLPTIIMPHGGPMARDNWQFDYWVQFLTSQGYAVLQMNYRGSTGYGDDYIRMGFSEWGGKMIEDINDGAKWMIEQGYSDPDRMCIVGGSYGGYAALQAVLDDPSIYKCSVAFAPVTNLDYMLKEVWRNSYYYNYIASDDYTLEEKSPSLNAEDISVPVLVLHGEYDRSVEIDHSRFFHRNMKNAGKDIKYIEWEDGDHFLSKEVHRVQFLEEMGRFLKEHL